jgi:hypothetical protein
MLSRSECWPSIGEQRAAAGMNESYDKHTENKESQNSNGDDIGSPETSGWLGVRRKQEPE